LRGHGQEAKIGEAGEHRITRNCEALESFLLPCATTELSLIVMWRLIGATPRGQPWTPAVTLPQGRDGLSARRMAVLLRFRGPSLGRHVPHELLRNAVLHLTLIVPTTACHQRNYAQRYSRFNAHDMYQHSDLLRFLTQFARRTRATICSGVPHTGCSTETVEVLPR
jgi:hypothetical protein